MKILLQLQIISWKFWPQNQQYFKPWYTLTCILIFVDIVMFWSSYNRTNVTNNNQIEDNNPSTQIAQS